MFVTGDRRRGHPVHSGGACSLVAAHPLPRHGEEIRVIDEVEQVIEPAAGIFGRPSVQLGLHLPYPLPRPERVRPRLTSIHQRLQPLQFRARMNPLCPLRHVHGLSPARPTRGTPPHPRAVSGRRACHPLPPGWLPGPGPGTPGMVPTFTMNRSTGEVHSGRPALDRPWGIGKWTAEMFLMFQLQRLDVWPTGDLGVRKGFGLAWGIPTPTAKELEPLGDPYRPYRSVVAWYCWRAAELYAGAADSALTR